MKVPLLDVNIQNLPLEQELTEAFTRVLKSGRFIMGPEMEAFEQRVADLVGAKHGISVSSGTDALLLALMSLDIKAGDEVICPSFTFFATAGCIYRTGATPVFVDCCPVCFNIDTNALRTKITENTKAIIPVHLFGQSADMNAIMKIAEEHDLKVIEDGAQAIGSSYKGKGCGSMGDFGTYSFFPSKNLGGFGDGGMVVTSDDTLAEKAKMLRNHGSHVRYHHKFVGANFRFDPLQAALLDVKLNHYDSYTDKRQANAAFYHQELSKLNGVTQAKPEDCKCIDNQQEQLSESNIILPVAYEHNKHIWNQFTIRVLHGKRDDLKAHLTNNGVACETYYPVPMHQQECFKDLPEHALSECPVSDQLAKEVLSIPIYPELDIDQKQTVVDALSLFLNE